MRPLTTRQIQVLLHISDGLSDAEIAAEMGLSVGTINRYVHAIRDRLSARNRAHALVNALRAGLIDFDQEGVLCATSPR